MKQALDLQPIYHRKEERIRAHVVLRWLALLLVASWGIGEAIISLRRATSWARPAASRVAPSGR